MSGTAVHYGFVPNSWNKMDFVLSCTRYVFKAPAFEVAAAKVRIIAPRTSTNPPVWFYRFYCNE